MKVGVLALQGAVSEHLKLVKTLGAEAREVRYQTDFPGLDALIIPGGESTTLEKLMKRFGLDQELAGAIDSGLAVWGTCAGMILLAQEITNGAKDQKGLGHLAISVERNAFGRQVESCEIPITFKHLLGGDFSAVFIRAPRVVDTLSKEVEVLATHESKIVAVRQGNILATSFHPELTGDVRLHQFFLDHLVKN